MATKAKLATEITLDSTNFSKGLQNAINSLDQFRERNKKVAKETKGSYRNIADGLNKLVVGGFKIGVKAATAFSAAIAALKAVTLSWNVVVLKTSSAIAAEFEKLQVAYASLTGSTEKATEVLARLEQQSLKTGVSVKDQSNAVQKFLALGFDPERALRLNEAILDVAGSVGLTSFQANQLGFALAQVANKGVVQMEELRQQIAEKGVPVFEALEEKTGLFGNNLLKALKNNKVPAEVLLDIFENLEGRFEKFRGGSERLGKTLAGTINRLKAAIAVLQRIIGEQFNVQLQQFFERIFNFLVSLKDEAQELGKFFGQIGLAINKITQSLVTAFQEGELQEKLTSVLKTSMLAAGNFLKLGLLEAFEFAFKGYGKYLKQIGNEIKKISQSVGEAVALGLKQAIGAVTDFGEVLKGNLIGALTEGLVNTVISAVKLLEGVGDIIRSTWSPELNEFIAKIQTFFEMLGPAADEFGLKIKDIIAEIGFTIEKALINAAKILSDAFAKPFEVLEEKIRQSPLLKLLGATPPKDFKLPNFFGVMSENLQKLLDDKSEENKKREDAAQKRKEDFDTEVGETLNKFTEANTQAALEESGARKIGEAVAKVGQSAVSIGEALLANNMAEVNEAQNLTVNRIEELGTTLKSMLGIMNLDLPVQREILKVIQGEETPEERDRREQKQFLEEKLGPPPKWAKEFTELDNFFQERPAERLIREAAGLSQKELAEMSEGAKSFWLSLGEIKSGIKMPGREEEFKKTQEILAAYEQQKELAEKSKETAEKSKEAGDANATSLGTIGEKLSEAAAKIQQGGEESSKAFKQAGQSSSEQMRQTAEETSNGLRRAGETIAQAAERLGLSIANSALDPKAFWKQVRQAGGMVATPEQVQAAFMSLDDWVKKQASFFANRTDPKPDWIQRWSEGNITEGLRNMVYEMYRKDLGLPLEPEPFKELTKQDRSQAFWQSVKDIQNKVVQNTSNLMSVSDKYGKQSYDAQRESNRLAKQNQSELAGINQRLQGLGLIAA